MTWEDILAVAVSASMACITGGFLRYISHMAKEWRKTYTLLQDAMRATICDRIVQAHDHFEANGFIRIHSLKSLEELYKNYTALNGNGFISHLMEDIRKLPYK
jgi:hypothetical protein